MQYKNYSLIQALIERAREFRKEPTTAQSFLWLALKNRALGGYKFRRQQPIDRFIVDFFCLETKLVIEVDGDIHESQRDYDFARQQHIETMGLRVLRFSNDQVLTQLEQVKEVILFACDPSPEDGQNKRES